MFAARGKEDRSPPRVARAPRGSRLARGGPSRLLLPILFLFAIERSLGVEIVAFVREDANADPRIDLADAMFSLSCLFEGAHRPTCRAAADANSDGAYDISDAVFTLVWLFSGGPALAAPSPSATAYSSADCDASPTHGLAGLVFAPCETAQANEDCGNGVDDDGDGRADCADVDCCGESACEGADACLTPPPDPSTIAPELSTYEATSLGASLSFLYESDDPVQRYDRSRMRSMVLERRSSVARFATTPHRSPASASTCRSDGLGSTVTREDGAGDVIVTGGATSTTVRFDSMRELPVQRSVLAHPG